MDLFFENSWKSGKVCECGAKDSKSIRLDIEKLKTILKNETASLISAPAAVVAAKILFPEKEEFETKFVEFINKLNTYKPREYILENLGVEKCAKRFKELVEKMVSNDLRLVGSSMWNKKYNL